ncbi:PKD domain-containing protein [Portibacter marinus]|uniref:PKD domain-containing protein n=1 Tax=Portibacter marinus TaxID=2898660 RepID=UPI001F283D41|nr:PKD domain-containing protein [Portibacter marinus]
MSAQITVDFSVDKFEGCNTVQSKFQDESSSTAGDIVSWEWQLGSVTSTLKAPGRVFTDVGEYTICLKVTDAMGNEDELCKEDFIKVYGSPIADFANDFSVGCAPLEVEFNSLSSSPNGSIVQWSWGLGGDAGTISTQDPNLQASTTYLQDGTYTVTLQITDSKGCQNTVTKLDLIEVSESPEIIVTTKEAVGCQFPMTVDFDNLGSSVGIEYEWDFGNGQSHIGYDPGPFVYQNAGNYDVTIKARFISSGCEHIVVLEDHISEGGLIDFDFSPKVGCIGVEVQFEDLSSITAESWEWDFGDGNTSSERDPVHRFTTPGTYDIMLFRNTGECSGTKISSHQIIISDNPEINGSYDNPAGCKLPASITLNASGNDQNQYSWFVGEPGNYVATGSGKTADISVAEYGTYRLSLIANNEFGCKSSKLLDSIVVEPLMVEVIGNLDGCVPFIAELDLTSNVPSNLSPEVVRFTGPINATLSSTFYDVEVLEEGSADFYGIFENDLGCRDTLDIPSLIRGGPAPSADFELSDTEVCPQDLVTFTDLSSGVVDEWSWKIGDTLVFDQQNFQADFDLPGVYDVELTIGANGCFVSKILEDHLTVSPPANKFDLLYHCDEPTKVTAINLSTQADSWDWTYSIGGQTILISNEDTVEINFAALGTYAISLEATDISSGCSNLLNQIIDLKDPKADFDIDVNSGCAPLTVNFMDQSTDVVKWEYFPSGANFSNPNGPNTELLLRVAHEYDNIGVVVSDIHGCTDTMYSETITVNAAKARFAAPDPVCFSDVLSVTPFSTSAFGNIIDYKWILGDNLLISNEKTAEFTAPSIGKFDLKLVVEDDWGCKDSTTLGLGAFFRAPNFNLLADSLACTTQPLTFRNGLHSPGYQYIWDFGDGNTSTDVAPMHLFVEEGAYQVSVTIEDEEKCINSMNVGKLIEVADPHAEFQVDTTFAPCPPLIVNFSNLSQNAVEYEWNYGDDNGSGTEFEPSHLYSYGGNFDVELIAIRSQVCKDTFSISELIKLDGPKGNISFEVDSSCVPLSVKFLADLEEEYKIVWDFGDGNLLDIEEPKSIDSVIHTYQDPGSFVPKIILTNNKECTIIREGESILTNDLEANFILSDSSFCDFIPNSVLLTAISESTSPIQSTNWNISGAQQESLEGNQDSFQPAVTGFYNVELIVRSEYCNDTIVMDSILKVGESPEITVIRDTVVCKGQTVDINYVTDALSEDAQWFAWDLPIDVSSFIPLDTTAYIIQIANEFDCLTRDTVEVNVLDDHTKFAGEDRTICLGESTVVNIDYGDQINWPTLEDCRDCSSVQLSPLIPTIYPVEVINDYGCAVRDSLFINVLTQDDIDAGIDQKICNGQQALLTGSAIGQIAWTPSTSIQSAGDLITSADIDETTMFTLTSISGECILRDSVLIEVVNKAELLAIGDTICYGEEANLFAGGLVDGIEWEEDETLMSSDEYFAKSNTTVTRDYRVIGILEGCVSDTAQVNVFVHPEIKADLPDEKIYFKGASEVPLEIRNLGDDAYNLQWMPAEIIDCPSCEKVKVRVDGSTLNVLAKIENAITGCFIEKSVVLREIDQCQEAINTIGVPNIFSPNEDGVNDYLNIDPTIFVDIQSIDIYDRWGHKMFHSQSVLDAWDGNYKGSPATPGVYTYKLTAQCPNNGGKLIKSGDVTLIR